MRAIVTRAFKITAFCPELMAAHYLRAGRLHIRQHAKPPWVPRRDVTQPHASKWGTCSIAMTPTWSWGCSPTAWKTLFPVRSVVGPARGSRERGETAPGVKRRRKTFCFTRFLIFNLHLFLLSGNISGNQNERGRKRGQRERSPRERPG